MPVVFETVDDAALEVCQVLLLDDAGFVRVIGRDWTEGLQEHLHIAVVRRERGQHGVNLIRIVGSPDNVATDDG